VKRPIRRTGLSNTRTSATAPTDSLYGTVRLVDDRHLQVGIENGGTLRIYEPDHAAPGRLLVSPRPSAGRALNAIAERLIAQGVPTSQGGIRWYPSTVSSVLRSIDLDAEALAAG
jgi:hypothetical protein